MTRPVIGITADNRDHRADSGLYESSIAYSRAVAAAGGLPVILPHEVELVGEYLARCHGFVLTGGADPRTEAFGVPTHPKARPMDERRQAFELALLQALDRTAHPVLGVCLGMQLMTLHHGGSLDQCLPESLGEDAARIHQRDNRHRVIFAHPDCAIFTGQPCEVVSWHRQAAATPGGLRIVARAPDNVIEAVDLPGPRFYVGVQWHPERGGDGPLNSRVYHRLVEASRPAR